MVVITTRRCRSVPPAIVSLTNALLYPPGHRRTYKVSPYYGLPYDDMYLTARSKAYRSPYYGYPYAYDDMYLPNLRWHYKVAPYFGYPYASDDLYLENLRRPYRAAPYYGYPYPSRLSGHYDDKYWHNLRRSHTMSSYLGRPYIYDDMYLPRSRRMHMSAYHGHPYWYDDMFVPSLRRPFDTVNYDYPYYHDKDLMRFPALQRSYWMPAMYRYPFEVNYDYGFGPASRKAQRISQYLTDDQESLRSQSRRQDAALMRDITSRMDDANLHHAPPVTRRSRARSPVSVHLTSSSRSHRASSVPPHFRETKYVDDEDDFFLRPSHRSRFYVEDYEPYHYKPITSYVSHQVRRRAGSEPPVDRTPGVFSIAGSSYTPSSDLAVRQARASLGRLERELSSGWEDPYYTTEEYLHTPVRPYRQASLAGFTTAATIPPIRSFSPVRGYSPVHSYSTVTHTPAYPRRSRYADIEAHVDAMVMPETSSYIAGLRSRAADARSRLGEHKVMLDRYLPLHLGPEKEVGMPQLEKYRPVTTPSKPAPYRPAPKSERRMSLPSTPTRVVAPPPPRRPPMSDARKRARQVLCKTKHDPEYFNY